MSNDQTSSSEPMEAADEPRLVRRAQSGDQAAMDELVRRCRPRLVHLLTRRLGCTADAEDVAQQALMRALQRIDQHDGKRAFSVWLYRIALRLAVDHRRKARPQPGLDCGGLCDCGGQTPEQAVLDSEFRDNLWSIAEKVLSVSQYSALWLRYAEQMSIQEAAKALGRTQIATRVLLHRARGRLAPHVTCLVEDGHTRESAESPVDSPIAGRSVNPNFDYT